MAIALMPGTVSFAILWISSLSFWVHIDAANFEEYSQSSMSRPTTRLARSGAVLTKALHPVFHFPSRPLLSRSGSSPESSSFPRLVLAKPRIKGFPRCLESSENVARKSGWEPLSTRSSIWLLEKGDSLGDPSMLGKKAFPENGGGGRGNPRFFENITPGDGRSHLPRDKACGPMRREVVPGTSPMPREQMLLSQDQREPMFLQRRLQRKWLKAHAPESYNGSLSVNVGH
ncbi:hypothetical protein BGZ57DRAFT_850597 [Hyaloscypha finlandica]|nr:hypothetical protein BGZ57DRAFT_850597 [Hyaloscypha finlandica]